MPSVHSEAAANKPAAFAFLPPARGREAPPFSPTNGEKKPKKNTFSVSFQRLIQTRINTKGIYSLCEDSTLFSAGLESLTNNS